MDSILFKLLINQRRNPYLMPTKWQSKLHLQNKMRESSWNHFFERRIV